MHDPRDRFTYELIGAAMAVHTELGAGFLEAVYQEAYEIELRFRSIAYLREAPLAIEYRGLPLSMGYRVDFICYGEIRIELKALGKLGSIEKSQVLNYLKASRLPKALLINSGAERLEYKRFVL